MADKQIIYVETEDEMLTQLKILLNNNYDVAIRKNDNLLGYVNYMLAYTKKEELKQ